MVTPHRVQVLLEPVPESFELSVVKTGSVSDRDALGVEKGETVLICWPRMARRSSRRPMRRDGGSTWCPCLTPATG
ncbi:MAG: hypothetical protein ACLSDQ_03895 [Adlercreutzia equolifaciens]